MKPDARRHLEAILMVADSPVPVGVLAQVLEAPVAQVRQALVDLAEEYALEGRGFCMREVGGGWRFYSHPDSIEYVERFVTSEDDPRLSKAALETLAVIAYRQPMSRAQVAEVRGVNCDGIVRNLTLRGLIVAVGVDDGPGLATLYGTSRSFLEQLGLSSIDDLPPLSEFVPDTETAAGYDSALSSGDFESHPDIAARVKSKIARLRADVEGHG